MPLPIFFTNKSVHNSSRASQFPYVYSAFILHPPHVITRMKSFGVALLTIGFKLKSYESHEALRTIRPIL